LALFADGNLRVISNIPSPQSEAGSSSLYGAGTYGSGIYGGEQYQGKDIDDTLKIKDIIYTVNSNTAQRTIQLGGFAVQLDRQIVDVNKNIEALRVSLGR
jgi:hypothetical protein